MKTPLVYIHSSHGALLCDATGRVIEYQTDCEKGCENCITSICKVDLEEYRKHYKKNTVEEDIDILDVGTWTATGEYSPPDQYWRKEFRTWNHIYGTNFGTHTPEQSFQHFLTICRLAPELPWEDTSWHNDMSDSTSFKKDGLEYRIWMPNKAEGPDYDWFGAVVSNDDGEWLLDLKAQTAEEAVNFIKGFMEKQKQSRPFTDAKTVYIDPPKR